MQHHQVIQSVTYILGGTLLSMFTGFDGGWACSLAAVFGFVMFFKGLGTLKTGIDAAGQGAVNLLTIAAVIGAASAFFDMIPVLGKLSGIGFVIAFGLELFGLLRLRSSATIGQEGRSGVTLLVISMGLAILTALFGLLPFVGGFVASFFALGAIIFVFLGWTKVQQGVLISITP
ncbi:MAG: hypothetical protein IPN76_04020 [Saprospiraceae bacterium]|nr:hypothetical protein [Saprospiraceae bacterium]